MIRGAQSQSHYEVMVNSDKLIVARTVPRVQEQRLRLYVTGEATVLIQDITGYAVICNKIDRKDQISEVHHL